ncbi:MAG: hypothetical protein AAFX56_20460 [Pseudomonadota bacterium]
MTGDTESLVQLEAEKTRFFSGHDEAAFFEWIKKIPSVQKIEGKGSSTFLYVDDTSIDENELRELVSLFRRYGVSMGQLSVFNRTPFSEWFHDKKAYWFSDVFGVNQGS